VDRRFVCQHCGTKWFLHTHATSAPELTECGRGGGPLMRFSDGLGGDEPYGTLPGEVTSELDEAG